MLALCMFYYNKAKEALAKGVAFSDIVSMDIRDQIARMKYLAESESEKKISALKENVEKIFEKLIAGEIKREGEDEETEAEEADEKVEEKTAEKEKKEEET